MALKSSLFNCAFDNTDLELLLFNTRTARRTKFRVSERRKVEDLLSGGRHIRLDPDDAIQAALKKDGFLLEEDFDELRWIEYQYSRMQYDTSFLSVTILPTVNCNFRCIYCYETPEEKHMTAQTVDRVKLFFNKKIPGCKQVKISWFGGEPLLQKDQIIDIMQHVNMVCKKYGAALIGTMNTNGYLLDADTFRKFVSLHIRTYEICIDGPPECHNVQRPHYKHDDSYQKIVSNLVEIRDTVKSNAFAIGIRTNVTPGMEACLEKHIRQMSESFSGDPRFYLEFQGVRDWGGGRIEKSQVLGTVGERELHKNWHDVAHCHGMKSIESVPIIPFSGYCEAPMSNGYVINYDGTLHKCTIAMFTNTCDADAIGTIDQFGNPVVDEEKVCRWIVRPSPIRDTCKACKVFPLCVDGHCAYQRNVLSNHKCSPILEMIEAQMIQFDRMGKVHYCIPECS